MAIMNKPTGRTPSNSLLEDLRTQLALSVSNDPEQLLASMSEEVRDALVRMAREATRVMRFTPNLTPAQAITRLYPNADMDKRKVLLALLNAEEEPPQPRPEVKTEWDDLPPLEETLARASRFQSSRNKAEAQTDTLIARPERPQQPSMESVTDGFMEALIASESSGRADAEYVTHDGRRHVGLLQFSDARLQDYRNATGASFTQDEFAQDVELQARVSRWHIASIDAAIDNLGEAAAGLDRDGLRAVAHLGGEAGMRRFVRTNGDYNPSDELNTSLSDYYARFSSGAS